MATQLPFQSDGVNIQAMPEIQIGAQKVDSNASHLKFTLVDSQEWSLGPDGSLAFPDDYTTGTPKLRVTVDTVTLGVTGQPDQPAEIGFTGDVGVSDRIVFIDNQNYDYPSPGSLVNGGGFTNATVIDFDQNNYQFIVLDQSPVTPTLVGDVITLDDGSTTYNFTVNTRETSAPNYMFFVGGNKEVNWQIAGSLSITDYATQDSYLTQYPCSWDGGNNEYFGFIQPNDASIYTPWPTDGTPMTISGLIMTEKLTKSVVIGTNAATGASSYTPGVVAIGHGAGQNIVQNSVVIGHLAGGTPASDVVSIGERASQDSSHYGVAVGGRAAINATGEVVVIGNDAGYTAKHGCIDIGPSTGVSGQNQYAIAIGSHAGRQNQGNAAIAIGRSAGNINMGANSVAIGNNAGPNNMGHTSTAVGHFAGRFNPAYTSGTASMGSNTVAVGSFTFAPGNKAVSIGDSTFTTSDQAIAIGFYARTGDVNAISIGAESTAYLNSVSIGYKSMANNAGVAIGSNAQASQYSVVLNATDAVLGSNGANSFVVKPVRNVTGQTGFYRMVYNPTTGEIGYSTTP